jgi:PAS domain S-box-containing protein
VLLKGQMVDQPAQPEDDELAQRVREGEERVRLALEAGRMGTWRFDLKTGEQQWSEQQFRLFGLTPGGEPPTRELFLSMVHPDDRDAVAFTEEDLRPGGRLLDAEFRIVRPDGETRWLVAHTVVRHDSAGQPLEMVGVNWDITERKASEQQLRRSEERLRMALEAGRMGTFWADLKTGRQEWSESEYEIFGLDPATVPPTREAFLSIVHPEDVERVAFSTEDTRKEGTSLDSSFRIVRPNGEVRHLVSHALARFGPDGRPAELIGVNQDITDRIMAEEAARHSEERLREFGEASSDVLWIRSAQTLQWEYLSPAFDKIYGISRLDALRGDNLRSWLDIVLEDDRELARRSIERVRAGERVNFEYRIVRPQDGRIRWMRNTDFPMRDARGQVVRIGGVGSDITALKEGEEHQRLLLSELQHRVRNTLSVIRSIARRTARSSSSVEEYAMNLESRLDAFARVQGAVTRDPQAGVDLAMLVAEELRAASAREGENVHVSGPPFRVRAQAAETLALAIHELATNAIKHGALSGPPGGHIAVDWRETAGALDFSWTESNGPAPSPAPRRRGLGSEILERTVPYELGGETVLAFERDGINFHMMLPLERIRVR